MCGNEGWQASLNVLVTDEIDDVMLGDLEDPWEREYWRRTLVMYGRAEEF